MSATLVSLFVSVVVDDTVPVTKASTVGFDWVKDALREYLEKHEDGDVIHARVTSSSGSRMEDA